MALLFAYAAFAFGLWVNALHQRGDQLGGLEDANRFAKLFLEDIEMPLVDPPVVIPQEPVKPIVLPKPKPDLLVNPNLSLRQ